VCPYCVWLVWSLKHIMYGLILSGIAGGRARNQTWNDPTTAIAVDDTARSSSSSSILRQSPCMHDECSSSPSVHTLCKFAIIWPSYHHVTWFNTTVCVWSRALPVPNKFRGRCGKTLTKLQTDTIYACYTSSILQQPAFFSLFWF